jgi:hypothetical protein
MPFPRLSHATGEPVDDWEHFLIWEAVMDRFTALRAIAENAREKKEGAKRQAEKLLEQARPPATVGA